MAVKNYILVCGGSACESTKSNEIFKSLLHQATAQGVEKDLQIIKTGCFGFCEKGPIVKVLPDEAFYVDVKPEDAEEIISENIIKGRLVDRILYKEDESRENYQQKDIKFYQKQERIVLRNCGLIDPESIDEYIARDGYVGLEKALFELSSDDILEEIKQSGLRGRGGAGFPTGFKWGFTKQTESDQKYVICNADEGDPGAYMDRATLEGDPHSVIEAMIIAGKCVGANEGVIYIRAEYPLAIERLEIAMTQAREYGLLGDNILDTDFSFNLEIRLGAGAFVCGEETALLASVEGKRGMPIPKPPFPAVKGLFGKPSVINNVETFANIPVIICRGGSWFSKIGTKKSSGTKVFALTGKIKNSGLIEVPMGTTLREIVFDIGGGIPNGKKFKAVQTGGPSGGVLTEDFLDTPIDFDSLVSVGSMMGSGGMIVMDEDDCMVDIAKFYMEFCVEESCGKCAPCRIGTKKVFELLEIISQGKGEISDVQKIKDMGDAMKRASLCGLGQTAPNPVLSIIKSFKEEMLEHINEKKCRAGKCKDLVTYLINQGNCIGCTVCARKCPVNCIKGERKLAHKIDLSHCIKCGACFEVCKFNAVIVS